MTSRRRLALTAAVIAAAAATFIATAGSARAQTAQRCGGHDRTITIPERGDAGCYNARPEPLLDGELWTATVVLTDTGYFSAVLTRQTPATVDIPIEWAWHYGDSGQGGPPPFTGVVAAGTNTGVIEGEINPADFVPYGCHTQGDGKAYNSDKDTPENRVRVAGPHFQWTDCAPTPDTTPTSSPTSSTPTVPPTVAPSTTPGTGGSSVPTVPGTLPATGGQAAALSVGALVGLLVGVGILAASRRATIKDRCRD